MRNQCYFTNDIKYILQNNPVILSSQKVPLSVEYDGQFNQHSPCKSLLEELQTVQILLIQVAHRLLHLLGSQIIVFVLGIYPTGNDDTH